MSDGDLAFTIDAEHARGRGGRLPSLNAIDELINAGAG